MPHPIPSLTRLFTSALLVHASAPAQDEAAKVDEIFRWATPSTPGCVVAVSRGGKLVVDRAYGSADLERNVPLSTDSVFDVGSLRKQVIAAAILLLVEDGRLSLTADVREHFSELPDQGHTITVDHLLTHTSGIRDWTGMLALTGGNADVRSLILRQRALNFAPGEEWSYSNSGYVLLKELVERVSGKSFAAFTRERLFEPLGMARTAYHDDLNAVIPNRALPYVQAGSTWKLDLLVGNERGGGGGLMSTAADLVVWNDALTSGRLGAFVTGKLEEPVKLNNGRQLTYARGVIAGSAGGVAAFVHTGGAGGYSAWLGRLPELGLSVALLCNTDAMGTSRLANRVLDVFLPKDAREPANARAAEATPAVEGLDPSDKVGLFFADGTGEELRLVADGANLRIDGGGPLVALAPDRFENARPTLFFRSEDRFELRFVSADEFELTSMEGAKTRYRRPPSWSPSAVELQRLVGRYESDEIPSALEVVPAGAGLALRIALAPDKSLPLRPVAVDVLEAGRMLLRFRRDAAGGVVAFDYSNPLIRGIRYVRVGDLPVESPRTDLVRAEREDPEAETAPPADAMALVGSYEGAGGRSITVTVENGKLHGEPTGNPKRELVLRSGSTYVVAGAPRETTVTFVLDAGGQATEMVLRQGGAERRFAKVR